MDELVEWVRLGLEQSGRTLNSSSGLPRRAPPLSCFGN